VMRAWLFPGQGSQYPGMGERLWEEPSAQKVVALAESLSQLPLCALMQSGPSEQLMRADVVEPAIAAVEIAYVVWLNEQGLRPDVVAGYSMGEIAALFAAGVIALEDALEIAMLRGQVLQAAADGGRWRMVSGTEFPPGYETGAGVAIAAWNAPGDVTITGEESSVWREETILIRAGAKLSNVSVSGPWHSKWAGEVAAAIEQKLRGFRFSAPVAPVFLGSTGTSEGRPEELRRSLSRQIATPVLWSTVLEGLWNAGVRETLEVGPGRTLTGFLRRNWNGRYYSAAFLERENATRMQLLPHKRQTAADDVSRRVAGTFWRTAQAGPGNGRNYGQA
jgi:[acyl-carrier-protein] S-malonyltransferase